MICRIECWPVTYYIGKRQRDSDEWEAKVDFLVSGFVAVILVVPLAGTVL